MTTPPTDRPLLASSRAPSAARWSSAALVMAASLTTGCYVYAEPATVRTTATFEADAYADPSYVTVSSPPPPIQDVAARPSRTRSNTVWVDGYWDWQGQWVWHAGEWRESRDGYEWEQPVCVAVEGGGYQYHQGYWRGQNQSPPPIYRTPGTIQVSADPTPVVQRVPIRPGQQTTGTVRVQPSRPSAPSDTVVVRPGTVSGGGTVTVRPGTQPSGNGTVVVRPGTGTTTVRPTNPNTNVTVRPSNPGNGTTTTVRPTNPNTNVTVRPSNPGNGSTTTVRPTNPNTTVTVRPSNPGTGTTTTVRPTNPNTNVTVRPSNPGTGTTTTVRPTNPNTNVTVRPSNPGTGTTTTVRPTNPNTNVTVRPSTPGTGTTTTVRPSVRPTNPGTGTTTTVRPNTTVTVRPSNPGNGATTTVRSTCNATTRVVPAGGVLTLDGAGLSGVVSVTIGGRPASIMSNNGSQIRARVGAMPGGGPVIANIGNERLSCGNVNVVGGAPR